MRWWGARVEGHAGVIRPANAKVQIVERMCLWELLASNRIADKSSPRETIPTRRTKEKGPLPIGL